MIAILLSDGTKIFSRDFKVGKSAIFVENFKFRRDAENVHIIEDGTSIHLDAIQSYAICHRGEKEEIEEDVEEVPEDRDGAPTPA